MSSKPDKSGSNTEHHRPNTPLHSVRSRIALSYAVLFCISAAVLMATGYLLLKRHLHAGIDRELVATAARMERIYCGLDDGSWTGERLPAKIREEVQKHLPDFKFLSRNREGRIVGSVGLTPMEVKINDGRFSRARKRNRKEARIRMQGYFELDMSSATIYTLLSRDGTPISILSKAGGLPAIEKLLGTERTVDGYRVYRHDFLKSGRMLILCAGTGSIQSVLQAYLTSSIVAMIAVLILGSYAGWFIANKAMRGVRRVAAAAEAIGNGELDTRALYDNDGSEVFALVNTFNTMAQRVQQLLQEQREITDNIAHDLRTPITRIRGTVETSMAESPDVDDCRKMAGHVVEDCDHLVNLINTTLEISQGDVGTLALALEQVDMCELAQQAVSLFQPLAADRGQKLALSAAGKAIVQGDRSRLQRVLSNLLDNAIKYTHEGGNIQVTIAEQREQVKLTVSDNGPGIPAAEHENVFRRFYRCDESRSTPGNGLGLSLIRAIIQAHRGTVALADSFPGLIVNVTLPKINKP